MFLPEESDLHKYSAVLAATEPIRLRCEVEIRNSMNPFSYMIYKLRGAKFKDPSGNVRIENKAVDAACVRYENRVDEVVRSYGLTPELFNSMSHRIKNEPFLKRRVLLQAYFYRIAADLEREGIIPRRNSCAPRHSHHGTALSDRGQSAH